MEPQSEGTAHGDAEFHRFVDRALFWFESATLLVLLLITLIQPTTGRGGVPTWTLLLLAIGYRLLLTIVRAYVPAVQSFNWKAYLDLGVGGVLYFVGADAGGPLFVLLFLAITCAAISLDLRGSLIYTAVVTVSAVLIDLGLHMWTLTAVDVRQAATQLVMLVLLGTGTAVLRRRLQLEQIASRAGSDEAARLEMLDQLRADFVATVSHDLMTPLTATRAGLGLLQTSAEQRLRPDEQELLGNARRNVDRLELQISGLLTHNQLEAGTLQLDRELLDLRAVVMDAMTVVHPLMREKAQILEVALPEPLPVAGDARRLEQVVVNLLANAHNHTPSGTRIAIASEVTADEVRLSIHDTGPGIPRERLAGIFERFHHFTSAAGGSGLGLVIAKRVIDLHDGRIWVESTLRQGTTFYLALPAAARTPMASDSQS
ncbi:MAG: HAMP domain-containing histidine kinase [Herpetosiphonaceae bacterium]|nr:HAMP domain-containing histidine kinase [Herpetosiphonaceae bacterium]